MIRVVHDAGAVLAPLLAAEAPGSDAIAGHLLATGHGRVWVDRWPGARVVAVEVADNWLVRGDPDAAAGAGLADVVQGFVDAPPEFEPLLSSAADRFDTWDRVIMAMDLRPGGPASDTPLPPSALPPSALPPSSQPSGAEVRLLHSGDAGAVAALDPDLSWIAKTWGGPEGMASSGMAWGAFVGRRLASVACTFFQGQRHEDIGVVTEPEFRRRGLSAAASARWCLDVQARGRLPTWTTTPDNLGSLGTARRLGFRHVRDGVIYLVGIGPPD